MADQLALTGTWNLALAVVPALAALVPILMENDAGTATLAAMVQWAGFILTGIFLLLGAISWGLALWIRSAAQTSDSTSQQP